MFYWDILVSLWRLHVHCRAPVPSKWHRLREITPVSKCSAAWGGCFRTQPVSWGEGGWCQHFDMAHSVFDFIIHYLNISLIIFLFFNIYFQIFFNPIFKSYWNLKILIQKSQNWFEYFDVLIVLNSIRNYITFASLYWAVHIYQLLSITLNRNGENLNLLVITLCRYEWMNQRNTVLLDLQV